MRNTEMETPLCVCVPTWMNIYVFRVYLDRMRNTKTCRVFLFILIMWFRSMKSRQTHDYWNGVFIVVVCIERVAHIHPNKFDFRRAAHHTMTTPTTSCTLFSLSSSAFWLNRNWGWNRAQFGWIQSFAMLMRTIWSEQFSFGFFFLLLSLHPSGSAFFRQPSLKHCRRRSRAQPRNVINSADAWPNTFILINLSQ